MSCLITICARGGSKGIPGKNIKLLNGIPLLAYSVKVAREFAAMYKADIALSTDDPDIRRIAADYGLVTDYIRPAELASDSAGKIDTIKDLLKVQETTNNIIYDYVLDLDVTSPLRTIEDLKLAFKQLSENNEALNIFSVNPATRNPYFNMVEIQENGFYDLVKRGESILSRQTAPLVYELNASFYFYKREFFTKDYKTVFTEKALIYVMSHLCFDLDHPIDFEFLDFLLSNNKLGFDL